MIFLLIRRWSCHRHKPLVKVGSALAIALASDLIFGTAFYFAESGAQPGLGFWDSVWWAMVSMTTVGYGDIYPRTALGRYAVAYPCLLIGIGLIGYVLGVIAQVMLESFNKRQKGTATLNFEDHLVICQCPSVSRVVQLVEQFRAAHGDDSRAAVVITPALDELPPEFREKSISFVKGSPTSEEMLARAGVARAAGVIILAGHPGSENSDAESFTTGTLVKIIEEDAGRDLSLVIELADRKNLRMMKRVRADGIVPADGMTDRLLMQEMQCPGIHLLFEHLITYKQGCEIYIVPHRLAGQSLHRIQIAALEHPANLQVIGALRGGNAILVPEKSLALEAADRLILVAESRADYDIFESSHLLTQTLPQTA